jgi:hypothetical protein
MAKLATVHARTAGARHPLRFVAIGLFVVASATATGARSNSPAATAAQTGPVDIARVLGIPSRPAPGAALRGAPQPAATLGEPLIMSSQSALSAALATNVGGNGVGLLGDWDGQEDLVADHSGLIANMLTPGVVVTRSAVSEHTIANGFLEDIFYYGDSIGNLYVASTTNLTQAAPTPNVMTINLPTSLNAFGLLNSDSQIVVTGIAVSPVVDLTSFYSVNSAWAPFNNLVGEVVYVSFTDTRGGLRLLANDTLIRSGVIAFPVADVASPVAAPPAVLSTTGFPVTVGGGFGVAFSVFSNLGGIAVDDDGSLYFHQVDLIAFNGGNIVKITPSGFNQTRSLATAGFFTFTSLNPLNGLYGSASGPVSQVDSATNYSGSSTTWGNVVAIATGPGNVLYAALSRSFVASDDAATQATEGLFTNPFAVGATPSMIVSLADCSGAFDGCLSVLPAPNNIAEPAAPGLTLTAGVNNFRVFALGDGPDPRLAPGSSSPVFGTTDDTLKLSFQIDYTIYSGITVDEEGSVYVVSGGTPAATGRNPSPNLGEILLFPDIAPADRRADYIDLRGQVVPNPPSAANFGDGKSDRFDHIFWQAPLDFTTLTPMSVSGLNRGFLLYLNRIRNGDHTPGLPNGSTQADNATSPTEVMFGQFDPGHQVAGGDDQVFPFTGDDSDGAGTPIVGGPLEGGFEFTFNNNGTPTSYNGFFLNSNGNITFQAGDTSNAPSPTALVSGVPRIAPAWVDLNPAARGVNPISFPVQAMGFAGVNHFKIRWINVPTVGFETCNCRNTFSLSLFDDGTGLDENSSQIANIVNPIGNNTVQFDLKEGPTALRFTGPAPGQLLGRAPRPAGSGYFTFTYGRMDLLGSAATPVLVGYTAGGQVLGGPSQQVVNFSSQPARIGDGTQLAIYEFFNTGVSLAPAFDLRFEGNSPALCTPSGQPDQNRGLLQFFGFTFPGHAPFANEPAIANVTPIRASDINDLRFRISNLRARAQALGAFVYTDASVTGSTPIMARIINETRQAITDVYLAFGLAAPSFTDVPLTSTTPIKAIHIQELRNAVGNLE